MPDNDIFFKEITHSVWGKTFVYLPLVVVKCTALQLCMIEWLAEHTVLYLLRAYYLLSRLQPVTYYHWKETF